MRRLAAALLPAAAAAGIAAGPGADVAVHLDEAGSYSVSVGGAAVLQGAPVAVHIGGQWWKAGANSSAANLTWKAFSYDHGTDPVLGEFYGTTVRWDAGGTPFSTRARNYEAGFAVLEALYPLGAQGTGSDPWNQHNGVVAEFPAFPHSGIALPHVLSWSGAFATPRDDFTLGPAGGPTVLFDQASGPNATVLIVSPLDWFKAASEAGATHDGTPAFVPGTSATFPSLPKEFVHRFVLYGGRGAGVTQRVSEWGALMRRLYATRRVADVTLERLSYQTDNGAQLCFCFSDCSRKLLEVKAALDRQGVPLGSISYQGAWWDNKYIHTKQAAYWCVSDFENNATKYPMDTGAFQRAVGVPLQLYAPYWCADTPYAVVNGGPFNMVSSNSSLPGCGPSFFRNAAPDQALLFYRWFFGKYARRYGMVSFEPDFLQENYQCTPAFIHNVSAAPAWQSGMAQAAAEAGLAMQWCMATPTDALEALKYPAVTNFRASSDYYYGRSWDIGTSSLLLWALGLAPSKDTFWTTDNGGLGPQMGGCDKKQGCPPDHSTPAAELHAMLAVMSTGPVGFSDAANWTDASLLRRLTNANGSLLQPSKPLTTIDVGLAPATRPQGYVLGTYSGGSAGEVWGWYVVSHQLMAPYPLRADDLWPPAAGCKGFAVRRWDGPPCANRSADCAAVAAAGAGLAELPPARGDPFAPTLTLVAPVCPNGWALLGELAKYASLSTKRFQQRRCTDTGVAFTVLGAPEEVVQVTLVATAARAAGGGTSALVLPLLLPASGVLHVAAP
eukprot:TRINITY_DN5658_c0_g2_i1.p1 TRINITY_DN5658_c0_g2~~TRINITY_DN5658_c0_g2_i1.p1  ORF type:complete len:820 (+),score=221.94 TRINITY_DN5658_c0_g2_i1:112-2460(+)